MSVDPEVQGQLHGAADSLATAAGVAPRTVDLQPVELDDHAAGEPDPAATGLVGPPPTPPSVEAAGELLAEFQEHLAGMRVEWDISTTIDLLACYLSSQFLLLAGPSGTGKSTAARALTSFFCLPGDSAVLEAKRQLIGPEDVAGYFSALSGRYVSVPTLQTLIDLAASTSDRPPGLLVEEINLSPPEGYLSHFVHGLSGIATAEVSWPLHADDSAESGTEVPMQLTFQPYLRLLGTINVDFTAMAPARKVASRACVVLLEPPAELDLDDALARLRVGGIAPSSGKEGAGASIVGSPLDIASLMDDGGPLDSARITSAIEGLVERLQGEDGVDGESEIQPPVHVTRRQVDQVLIYVAWNVLLLLAYEDAGGSIATTPEGPVDHYRIAAENGLLHFVLPTLAAADFTNAIRRLKGHMIPVAPDRSTCGAVLGPRIDRLAASGRESIGRLLDFWDRLS